MNKGLVIGAVLLSVVALGVSIFQPKSVETVREVIKERLGAFPGPDISSPFLVVNGVETRYSSMAFTQGTTTPCAFPIHGATSTIVNVTVRMDSATTTATVWNIATSTTAFATTSPIVPQTLVPASQQRSFDISVSTTSLVIGTSTWVVVGVNKASTPGYDPVSLGGKCTATWQAL